MERFRVLPIVVVCTVVCIGVVWTSSAQAQRLQWSDSWRSPTAVDGVVAGGLALAAGLSLLIPTGSPHWSSTNALDRTFDQSLRSNGRARLAARFSDVLSFFSLGAPLTLQPAIAFAHDRRVAANMFAVSSLSFSSAILAVNLIKRLTRRRRPGRLCDLEPTLCESDFANRSFPSGHSALAFTAAALACMFYNRLEVFETQAANAVGCGVAVGMATATGILRVVAGRHHITDVIVGALIGTALGWLLPSALYFGFDRQAT